MAEWFVYAATLGRAGSIPWLPEDIRCFIWEEAVRESWKLHLEWCHVCEAPLVSILPLGHMAYNYSYSPARGKRCWACAAQPGRNAS
jgi:hypothetical protein